MFSKTVIEDFDIAEGITSGCGFIDKDRIADSGGLVSAVEGLLSGIVVAVTFGAHALDDTKGFEHLPIVVTGIGSARAL